MDPSTPKVSTEIPSSVKRWNWGAFFLTWIWGLFNKTYISLLAFIPYIGLFVAIYLGLKGNELAWKNKSWTDEEAFHAHQKKWAAWSVGVISVVFVGGLLFAVLLGNSIRS